jgi:hypothetical protein
VALLNSIPGLPGQQDLAGLLPATVPGLDAIGTTALINQLKALPGPLSALGGILTGGGSVVSAPETMLSRSAVRLVDIPGSANKAVQSTSTLQVTGLKLFAGTPVQVDLNVVSQPKLVVLSTGEEQTSTVSYEAPVIQVVQGGKTLYTLDAAHPKFDLPIAVPLPGAPALPVIGELFGSGQPIADAVSQGLKRVDLGVIRLEAAQLTKTAVPAGQSPTKGHGIGATARLLNVVVLPTDALKLPNLPPALAQVSLGEQLATAVAPAGGVVCAAIAAAPQGPQPARSGLAYTTAAYKSVPIFWTGMLMLLAGVVLVAALPAPRVAPVRHTHRTGDASAGGEGGQ